jgi:hypothetical protein
MAQIAVLGGPGQFAVVARTTKLAIDNLKHIDLVTASLELKTQVSVADLATEPHAVEPVWKHYWTHPGGIGVIVNDNITVFGVRRTTREAI